MTANNSNVSSKNIMHSTHVDKPFEASQHNDFTKIVKSDEESKNFSIDVLDVSNSDENSHQFTSRNKGNVPKIDGDNQGIKLNFRGNKNDKEKNKYSEMPEVLNKNLIRCIRRYLKELYGQDRLRSVSTWFSKKKMDGLKLFYQKHMKSKSQCASMLSEDEELRVLHFISAIVQLKIDFKIDCIEHKFLVTNMNNLMKTYQSGIFRPMKNMLGFKRLLQIMKEAGLFDKMLELYPTLVKSKEAYETLITSLITTE